MAIFRTVGNGGYYSNWNDALSSLPLSWLDSYTFKQISDVEVTSELPDFDSSYNTHGNKLTIYSEKPHFGNINEGYKTIIDSALAIRLFDFQWLSENVEVFNMNFYVENFPGGLNSTILNFISGKHDAGLPLGNVSKIVHDNIFQIRGMLWTGIRQNGNMFGITNIISTDHYWNNIFLDPSYRCVNLREYDGVGLSFRFENNIGYSEVFERGIFIGESGTLPKYIRNNAMLFPGTPTRKNFVYSSVCVAKGNMSQDDSADDAPSQSDNIINVTPEDEFVSLDSSSQDFLKPKYGGNAYNMGIAPSIPGNTSGIGGNPRPWS